MVIKVTDKHHQCILPIITYDWIIVQSYILYDKFITVILFSICSTSPLPLFHLNLIDGSRVFLCQIDFLWCDF